MVRCVVLSKAVCIMNDFYRRLNAQQGCGTSTTYHDSKMPWVSARHVGLVDDDVAAYEHVFPNRLQRVVLTPVRAKEATFVLIEGNAERVYILTHATSLNLVKTQLDVETTILCAADMEVLVLGTRQVDSPFCANLLDEETPLNIYSKRVKFGEGVGLMELSGKLW